MKSDISERESRQLQRDVSEWQMLLDRCLADRFRGPYPVGDSLMMRLGTYQGAHHRFLVMMDTFAQQAYKLACRAIREKNGKCELPEAALATFIGNSPSAYATSHTIERLGCGFTDVPATLVCRLRDVHLLMHETGHHVVSAFFASLPEIGFNAYRHDPVHGLGPEASRHLKAAGLPEKEVMELSYYWKNSDVLREIREILADYFAACICFPAAVAAHKNASLRTLADFFDGGSEAYLRSVQTELRLRSSGIEALQGHRTDAIAFFDEQERLGLQAIKEEGGNAIDFERFKSRAGVIRHAVHAIQLLCGLPEFKALLDGFDECLRQKTFDGESAGQSLLEDLREFLASPDLVSLDGSFRVLDSLWFKLLRRREIRHLIGIQSPGSSI